MLGLNTLLVKWAFVRLSTFGFVPTFVVFNQEQANDEKPFKRVVNKIINNNAMGQTLIASVTSSPTPQDGQKHRSSGNFSTQTIPDGTSYLLWNVLNTDGSQNLIIHFDVMEDVSVGIDPTIYKDCYTGKQDAPKEYRSLYIANPKNATDNFIVQVFAVS